MQHIKTILNLSASWLGILVATFDLNIKKLRPKSQLLYALVEY